MRRLGNDQDSEIVDLLGKLRDASPEYPPHLYAARRAAIIAALAALPIGGALAVGLFAKLASVIKGMSMIDKIILGVEVAAITGVGAVGAATAYIYRDELKSILLGSPTAISTSTNEPFPTLSNQPIVPVVEETPVGTPTVTGTVFVTDTSQPANNQTGSTPNAAETQPPAEKTNPGLHLGNTKVPKTPQGP